MQDCERCFYWKEIWRNCGHCCHYAIINNRLRKRDGENCLSFEPKEQQKEVTQNGRRNNSSEETGQTAKERTERDRAERSAYYAGREDAKDK